VREFGDGVQAQSRKPVAHEVLDGLHIVAGDRLLLGQPVDLGLAEVAVEAAQLLLDVVGERRRLEQRTVGQRDQPLDLDLDAGAVQSGLGEVVAERSDGRTVTAVEGAERLDGEGVRGSQGNPPDRAPQIRGIVRGVRL